MKKMIVCGILLLISVFLVLPASAATEEHPHNGSHCVCGGSAVGNHDHVCANITWKPMPASTTNLSELSSGNYYLTQDVTITATTNTTNLKLTICLNGYDITTEATAVIGTMKAGCELNFCDCSGVQNEDGSWTWGGTVYANQTKAQSYGGIVNLWANSVANIYGGNFVGAGSAVNGGVFNVCNDGYSTANGASNTDPKLFTSFTLYNGHLHGGNVSSKGAVLNTWHTVTIRFYGGVMEGGTSATGGIISISAGSTTTIDGTMIKDGKLATVIVMNGTTYCAQYNTLKEALSGVTAGQYLRLTGDINENVTIPAGVTIDLAGNDLSGVTVESGALFMDSTTDNYTSANAGTLTPAAGTIDASYKTETGAVKRYLPIESNGSYAFHRFYMAITKLSLKPGTAGMGYKATFAGSDYVKEQLSDNAAYGYKMWVTEKKKVVGSYSASRFGGIQELTLRIDNFLDSSLTTDENNRRAQTPVYACVYIQLDNGTILETAPVSYTFQQQAEAVDTIWKNLTNEQKEALITMYSSFEELMDPWMLPNLRAGYIEAVQQISAQWDCSHTTGNTVNPGEEITYTITLTNQSNKAQTFTMGQAVPANTEYVSGGQLINGQICFGLSMEAGETKQISYTVQVKDDMALCGKGSVVAGGRELFIEYTLNAIDGQYFVGAVQALQDSSYSGTDLADRLYVHGFSQSVLTNNAVTDSALEDITSGKNTALLDMVAPTLFGGKSMPGKIAGVKGVSAGAVTQEDLINGDILLADGKIYAYANGLWLLEKGAKKQDTAAVLTALPEMEKYAVLRPSMALAGIITPSDMDATPDELNDYQEALIATAEAYLLRGEKLQYADTYFTTQGSKLSTEYRW